MMRYDLVHLFTGRVLIFRGKEGVGECNAKNLSVALHSHTVSSLQVLQTLEFARELSGQFKTLALEEEKNRKKQIKKDQQERNKMEIERVASTMEIQVMQCSELYSA